MNAWIPVKPLSTRAPSCSPIPYPGTMRALSVQPPWSYLLAAGYKPVENRKWKPPLRAEPTWFAIHSSLRIDPVSHVLEEKLGIQIPIVTGAIVGAMLVDGYVTESDSPWFVGPMGWTIATAVLLEHPIRSVQGALGTFKLQPQATITLERRWSDAEFFSWRTS